MLNKWIEWNEIEVENWCNWMQQKKKNNHHSRTIVVGYVTGLEEITREACARVQQLRRHNQNAYRIEWARRRKIF